MGRNKMIEIAEEEYLSLLDSQRLLTSLESAGVDNWSGYSYAMELYQEDEEDEE